MYHYIKCPTCNNSIGEYYLIFKFLREKKIKEQKNITTTSTFNYQFDEDLNIVFEDIYQKLHIDNICCKIRLSTYIEFYDLYNIDF